MSRGRDSTSIPLPDENMKESKGGSRGEWEKRGEKEWEEPGEHWDKTATGL
jgi:hypothetical protein